MLYLMSLNVHSSSIRSTQSLCIRKPLKNSIQKSRSLPSSRAQCDVLSLEHLSATSSTHSRRSRASSTRIGPVRIVFGKESYTRANILYIANAIAQISIGATNGLVLFYAIANSDLHAFFCCIGYHFFMIEAIMSLIYTNGWTRPLTLEQRKLVHIFLQLFGMICSFLGSFIAIFSLNNLKSTHSVLGILTIISASLTIFAGPFALFNGPNTKIFHILCSLPTVVLSSLCLGHALIGTKFDKWTGSIVPYILFLVTFVYTTYIVIMTFIGFAIRLRMVLGPLWKIFMPLKRRFPDILYRLGPIFNSRKEEVSVPHEIFLSIMNNAIQISIGAVNAMVLIYATLHRDVHVFFCCIGYNFFMIEAVLGMNNNYSWSSTLTTNQRMLAHTFLQNCGMVCVIIGSFTAVFTRTSLDSVHSVCGIISLTLALATFLIGPLTLFRVSGKPAVYLHKALAILTIITSTASLIYGLLEETFKSWTGTPVCLILCCIVLISCIFVIVSVFMKCLRDMKR